MRKKSNKAELARKHLTGLLASEYRMKLKEPYRENNPDVDAKYVVDGLENCEVYHQLLIRRQCWQNHLQRWHTIWCK